MVQYSDRTTKVLTASMTDFEFFSLYIHPLMLYRSVLKVLIILDSGNGVAVPEDILAALEDFLM